MEIMYTTFHITEMYLVVCNSLWSQLEQAYSNSCHNSIKMVCFVVYLVVTAQALQFVVAQNPQILFTAFTSNSDSSVRDDCPSQDTAMKSIDHFVFDHLQQFIVSRCGDGPWHRVAYLNMSDPSQQCPSAWREYTECVHDQLLLEEVVPVLSIVLAINTARCVEE